MSEYDIAQELSRLHTLSGAEFIRHLKWITTLGIFHPLENETDIYITGGDTSQDYAALLNAARKAVSHGYKVFILPNPKGIRTADFIFEQRGSVKMYDLKTISGKTSAGTRLLESIGQSNRVLLNLTVNYNGRILASDIKSYFEANGNAVEVLVFKGSKVLSVPRYMTESSMFNRQFRKKYEQ